jgi:2-keto-4-pentenoate hydratase/2-oxohepta-3-ene-1,7-dioic acid hydratase in catechol pathway
MRALLVTTTNATPFALGTFESADGRVFGGLLVDGNATPLGDIPDLPATVRELLESWDACLPALQQAADGIARLAPHYPLEELRPLPPVQPSGALLCAGANYRKHVAEMTEGRDADGSGGANRERSLAALDDRARTGSPYVWVGLASAMCGANDDIVLPSRGSQHDWELELAVVIGRRARHVPRDHALDVVAGYTICNDITTRDSVLRPDIPGIGTDWFAGKCAPTFFPTGPYIVPSAHAGDPAGLQIRLSLNGEVMQDSSTAEMIFDVAGLIEYTSSVTELGPGDVILTGSPAGNGVMHGRFLQPGDVIDAEISGLGAQRNRCVAESDVSQRPKSFAA